jgi:hypothetical protein
MITNQKLCSKLPEVYKTTRRTRDHKHAVYLYVETVHNSPERKTIACVTERSSGGIVLRTKCSHSYSPPTPVTSQAPTTLMEAKSQMSTKGNWAIEELKTSDDGVLTSGNTSGIGPSHCSMRRVIRRRNLYIVLYHYISNQRNHTKVTRYSRQ